MSKLQIVQSVQLLACRKCGKETNASCNCGVGYDIVEIAARSDCNRQELDEIREKRRKQKQKERSSRATEDKTTTTKSKAGDYSEKALDESLAAADRAEARCAAQWKAFTAEEERNAVSNIQEAIVHLTDEQRALLFQWLKESFNGEI